MQIYFQAFQWETTSSKLTLSQFIDKLTQAPKPIINKNRHLYIHDNAGMINGLLITIKDAKKFCKIVREGKSIKLTVHTLKNNENVADFNFFVFDKNTGRGMYQYYHHSCSLNVFNTLGKSEYKGQLDNLKDKAIASIPAQKTNLKFLSKVRDDYAGHLITTVIERPGKFIERIKCMKDINCIDLEFSSLEYEQNEFSPVATYITKAKHRLTLSSTKNKKEKVSAAYNLFAGREMRRARVFGLDEDGNDVVYKLLNDFDRFASFEYDDLVPSLSLDSTDAEKSINANEVIKKLRETYKKCALSRATTR